MYSAYKLNKQGDNIQPWCPPFPIWSQSVFPCLVLNVASWSGIQISQEEGRVVWHSHLLKNFQQFVVIHTVKDFSIVNEGEVEVFLELSCFFYNQWILAIWTPLISVVLKSVLSHPWLQVLRLPQCRAQNRCACPVNTCRVSPGSQMSGHPGSGDNHHSVLLFPTHPMLTIYNSF